MANIFNESIQGVKLLRESIALLTRDMQKLVSESKKVTKGMKFETTSDIKKLDDEIKKVSSATKELNTIAKDDIRLKKEQEKLLQEQQRTLQSNLRTKKQVRVEEERQVKIAKKLERESKKLNDIYATESRRLNDLRRKYKNLILSEKGATTATKKLKNEIGALDRKLKKADADVGQFQRSVGNYKQAVAGSLGTVGQFATGVGAISAGILLAGKAIGSAIGIIKNFQQANANLQAVLGKTKEEMQPLIEQAKQLGSTTSFSASQVTELQTELAKLGFPISDITQMAASTLDAANAMGSDLGEQAKLTGATLRSFGLDASETQRVNDVLAKATSASALDFQKLASSMSTIAPVANSFGFSLEGTTALLGELSNAGFDASSAATSTRNILLNLADANGALAKKLGEPVKDLPSLVKGLKKLESQGVNLGEALQLTDKRSVAAFSTFLKGTDSVLALNESLENAGGTAEEMARIQLDTLEGSIKILNSSWEGLILSMEDGNGVMADISKTVIKDLANGLSVLGGNLDSTNESFSLTAFWVTEVKTAYTALWGLLKLVTIPWRIIISLATKLISKFGFLKDSAFDFGEALNGITKIFFNLPAIINIVVDGIIKSFDGLADVILNFGKLLGEALNPVKVATTGGKSVVNAWNELGVSITTAFGDGIGGIEDEILRLLQRDELPVDEAEEAGEELGKKVTKGFKKGVKGINQTIKDSITGEEDLEKLEVTLDIKVDPFEESELGNFIGAADAQLDQAAIDFQEKQKKRLKEALKILQDSLDKGAQAQKEAHQKRLKQIDEELQANKDLQKSLVEDSKRGIADAEKNLVFARQREREAQLKRQQEVERQKRIEEGLAFVRLLTANAANPETKQPVLKSIAQFTAAKAFIGALSSLYEGTEDTGTVSKPLDSKGGRLAVLHDRERVVPEKDNVKMAGITNSELGQLAEKYKQGQLVDFDKQRNDLHVTNSYQTNEQTIIKMDELIHAVENIPVADMTWSDKEKAWIHTVKRHNSISKKHYKSGGIWG